MSLPGGLPGGRGGGIALPPLNQSQSDTERQTVEQQRTAAYDAAKQQYDGAKSTAQQQYQAEIDAAQEKYKQAVDSAKADVGDNATPEDVQAAQKARDDAIQAAREQLDADRQAAKDTYEAALQQAQEAYDSATQEAEQQAQAASEAVDQREAQQQQTTQQTEEMQAKLQEGSGINQPYVPGQTPGATVGGFSPTEGAVPKPIVTGDVIPQPGAPGLPAPGVDLDQNGIDDILELYKHAIGTGQPGVVGQPTPSNPVFGQTTFTQPYTPAAIQPVQPPPNPMNQATLSTEGADPTTRVVESAINTVMDRVGIPRAQVQPPEPPSPPAPPAPPEPPATRPIPPLEDNAARLQSLVAEQMKINPTLAPQLYGSPPVSDAAVQEQRNIANAVNAPRATELPSSPPTAPQAAGVAVTPQALEQRSNQPSTVQTGEPFIGGQPSGGAPPSPSLPTVSSPAMGAGNAAAQTYPRPAAASQTAEKAGTFVIEDYASGGWVEVPPTGQARFISSQEAARSVQQGAQAIGQNASTLSNIQPARGAAERPDAQAAPYIDAQGRVMAHPVAPIEGEAAGNALPTYRVDHESPPPDALDARANGQLLPPTPQRQPTYGIQPGDVSILAPGSVPEVGPRIPVAIAGTQAIIINDSNGLFTDQYAQNFAAKPYVQQTAAATEALNNRIMGQLQGQTIQGLGTMNPTKFSGFTLSDAAGGWNSWTDQNTREWTLNPYMHLASDNPTLVADQVAGVMAHEIAHSAQGRDWTQQQDIGSDPTHQPEFHGPRFEAAEAALKEYIKNSPDFLHYQEQLKQVWDQTGGKNIQRDNTEARQATIAARGALKSENQVMQGGGPPPRSTTTAAPLPDRATYAPVPRGTGIQSMDEIDRQSTAGYNPQGDPTNPNAVQTAMPASFRFDKNMVNPNYSFTRFVQPQGGDAGKLGTVLDQSLAMYDAQKSGTSRLPIRDIPVEEKAIVADAIGALAKGDATPEWVVAPLQNAARAAWQKANGDPGVDPKYADPRYVADWVNGFLEGKTDLPYQKELTEDIRRVGKPPPEDIAASRNGPSWIGKFGRDLGAGVKVDNEAKQLTVPQTAEMAARYGLGVGNTYAVCGPIAANGMLRAANGDDSIGLDQVWKKATEGPNPYWNGAWTGPVNFARFLKNEYGKDVGLVTEMSYGAGAVADLGNPRMGVRPSEISQIMAQDVTDGKPVTVSISGTNGHYFVATDYDPNSNKFYVGTTGTVYRGGSTWMSLDQMKTTAGGGGISAIRFNGDLKGETKGEPYKVAAPGSIQGMDAIDQRSVATPSIRSMDEIDRLSTAGQQRGEPASAQNVQATGGGLSEMASRPTTNEPEIRSLQQRILTEAPKLPDKPLGSMDETIKAWAPTLQWVEQQTGLPAEYVAGIVMAENGFGNSSLSSQSNNYFSIGSNPQYDRFASGVDSGGRFARYPTPQAALARFVGMVAHPENTYNTKANFWKNRNADSTTFVRELVKGGYLDVSEGFPESAWRANIEKGAAQYRRLIQPQSRVA